MPYVALFDILGFKQAILETSLEELKAVMGTEFNEVLDLTVNFRSPENSDLTTRDGRRRYLELSRKECSYIRFSDTIVLFSEETEYHLGHMFLACNKLISFMMLRGLPVRGVVTRGELYVDKENSLVIGEALVRAHALEGQQAWSGAFVDPERILVPDDIYEEYRTPSPFWEKVAQTHMLFRYRVPFMTEMSFSPYQWCLAWPIDDMPESDLIEVLFNKDSFSEQSRPKELDERARKKLLNTLEFFRAFEKWKEELWFFPNVGADFGFMMHVTCHVCDQGTIYYSDGCPGCGRVNKRWW